MNAFPVHAAMLFGLPAQLLETLFADGVGNAMLHRRPPTANARSEPTAIAAAPIAAAVHPSRRYFVGDSGWVGRL